MSSSEFKKPEPTFIPANFTQDFGAILVEHRLVGR